MDEVTQAVLPMTQAPLAPLEQVAASAVPEQRASESVDIITGSKPAPARSGQTIAAVERALDVLLLFGEEDYTDLGVTEVASILHMSKAAVHRVLSSLRTRGLVTLDPTTHRYSLGASSLALGRAYLDRLDVRTLAMGRLAELCELTNETALLAVRSRYSLMFVDQVLPDRVVRLEVPIGQPTRLHVGSTGHVLLAALGTDDLDQYVEHELEDPLSGLHEDDVAPLLINLAVVAERGWAYSDVERLPGTASVSVPLWDQHRNTIAALTIGGPVDRIRSQQDVIVATLLDAGHQVSASMGWTPMSEEDSDLLS